MNVLTSRNGREISDAHKFYQDAGIEMTCENHFFSTYKMSFKLLLNARLSNKCLEAVRFNWLL